VFALEGLLKRDREVSLLLPHDRSADLLECRRRALSRESSSVSRSWLVSRSTALTAAFEIPSIEVDDRTLQGGGSHHAAMRLA